MAASYAGGVQAAMNARPNADAVIRVFWKCGYWMRARGGSLVGDERRVCCSCSYSVL
jgi:hypothetical protein